ncbi:hypothetical protein GCE86_08835 [Micromonospora terminaliae]|uniref:Uncharacterized protein n=1 Tax=Micromonospora terminaliae TaxID=1914461 RepID=A0ABX6DZ63_9ACTN|nr:hypothetical protein GCE86_08835 [Micromonospora terminaliae]
MMVWCRERQGAVGEDVGLVGEDCRGEAGGCGELVLQAGYGFGLAEDDAAEVLAVDVGRVEGVTDRVVNPVEEGLRGDGDVVVGDDRGRAGCGEQHRRAVLRHQELSGLADGFQQRRAVRVLLGQGYLGSQWVVVRGGRVDDALSENLVQVAG